jgi:tripartite-type tricarboxylate transporter receptor subunit TctC
MNRRTLVASLLACPFATASAQHASGWPSKVVRIVVVYPPGGLSDGIARSLAEKLALRWRVPVLVENRAGGGGSLGMEVLAKAAPDGHTLAFSAVSPLALKPHFEKVGYDPFKDIEPVAAVMYTPVLIVGTPAFDGKTFADLLALAKARPGALRWATSGVATAGHLVLEQVRLAANLKVTHIPYKGGGQQLNDALGGQFELLSTNVAAAQLGYVRSGVFKPLAVGAPSRLPTLVAVPTLAELGFPQANVASLFGVFAPGGTPAALLDLLHEEIDQVLQTPDFRERLLAIDNVPARASREHFGRQIAQQWTDNRRLKSLDLKLD